MRYVPDERSRRRRLYAKGAEFVVTAQLGVGQRVRWVPIMTPPKVLFVYYTHTEQAARVSDAMAEVLRQRGCDVTQAGIEFTEPRYVERFSRFPFGHAVFDIVPL